MPKDDLLLVIDEKQQNTVTAAIGSGTSTGTGDADTVDGFDASAIAKPNTLIALDANGKIPRDAMPDSDNVGGPVTGAHGITFFGPSTWLVQELGLTDTEIVVKHKLFSGNETLVLSHFTVPCEYIWLTGGPYQQGEYWKYTCDRAKNGSSAQQFPVETQAISLGSAASGGFIYIASADTGDGSAYSNQEYLPTDIVDSPYIAIHENNDDSARTNSWKVTIGRLKTIPTSFKSLFPDISDWDLFGLAANDAFLSGGIHALYGDIAGNLSVGGRLEMIEDGTTFNSWTDYGDATGIVIGMDDSVTPHVGKVLGLNNGAVQAYFDGDGTIKWAGGKGVIDSTGIEYTGATYDYWKVKPSSSIFSSFVAENSDWTINVQNWSTASNARSINAQSQHGLAIYARSENSSAISAMSSSTASGTYALKAVGGEYAIVISDSPVHGGNQRYVSLADAVDDTDALNRQTGDGRYLMQDGSTVGATAQAQEFTTGVVVKMPSSPTVSPLVVKDDSSTVKFEVDSSGNIPICGTLLGTDEGSYNAIIGSAFAAKSGYTYNNVVGSNIANAATGNVYRNVITGSNIANAATGGVVFNTITGYNIANAATGSVYYNAVTGSNIANAATSGVNYNTIIGYNIANAATGNVTYNTITGYNIANAVTGSVTYTFSIGAYNLYDTTNATNINRVVALPYEALRESSASDLTDAIAIGYRAGHQNTKNSPALFGREATATADKQVVIGSSFYTGGILLDADTHATGTMQIDSDIGFFATSPQSQITVTGSRATGAALQNLLTALADYGLIVDNTTT